MDDRDERGQVAPLLALVAVAAGLACLGLGRFAAGAVDHATARTAADAAALAGTATGDEAVAARVAARNGARLESYEAAGGDTRVRVRLDGITASARARAAAPAGRGGDGAPAEAGSATAVKPMATSNSATRGSTCPRSSWSRGCTAGPPRSNDVEGEVVPPDGPRFSRRPAGPRRWAGRGSGRRRPPWSRSRGS